MCLVRRPRIQVAVCVCLLPVSLGTGETAAHRLEDAARLRSQMRPGQPGRRLRADGGVGDQGEFSPAFWANQPPPEEPPVMVQPIRYIVGWSALTERRPGGPTHPNMRVPSKGSAAG